jgi:signal transduction protein with GAF and PtsI domain
MTLAAYAHGVYVLRQEQKRHRRRLTMRSLSITVVLGVVLASAIASAASIHWRASDNSAGSAREEFATVRAVAGSGVHYRSVIVHSIQATETGLIQTSTETIDLNGDLIGRILYQPTTVIDFVAGTLVNTGHQVFSGTVLGSEPVMLHDDEFRFDVNLATNAGTGKVYLTDNIAGPKIRCQLDVIATGETAEGNVTADYTGFCSFKNK